MTSINTLVRRVTSDATAIAAMSASMKRATGALANLKNIVAASCVMHAMEHGNVTPMNNFLEDVGKGERLDAIVKWALNFGPFKWEMCDVVVGDTIKKKYQFRIDSDKRATLSATLADMPSTLVTTPYWDFVPQPEVKPFDLPKVLHMALSRARKAEKDEAIKGKSNFKGLSELENLIKTMDNVA